MKDKVNVIQTKLFVPKVRDDSLRRSKLTKKLKTILHYPVTIVHSDAGYGKSTALAQYIVDEKQICCWYSISSAEHDLLIFLKYLTSSIRTVFPSFGEEIMQHLNEMNRYIREYELDQLCSFFIHELMAIKHDFILILDDYHYVENSYNINRWLEKTLENTPSNLHFIIVCRSKPTWKNLTKMKVQNKLLEITREDLILTKEEAELLFIDYNQGLIEEGIFDQLYGLTNGWVLALGMMAQKMNESHENISDLDLPTSKYFQDLFLYFDVVVYQKQPPIIGQFLQLTSILAKMNEELCDLVLGITGSGPILEQLCEKNLFIDQLGGTEYLFHPLFKAFLEYKFMQYDRSYYIVLHERCAKFFEERGQWEHAIYHYDKINHLQAIASLINDYGSILIEQGELERLNHYLSKLSSDVKNIYYRLWFLQGEVLRYRSQYKEAEKCYDAHIEQAVKLGDDDELSRGLEGKARIYLDTIQPYKAKRFLYKVIEIREKSEKTTKQEMGDLYHLLAENLVNSGQAKMAEKWIKRATSINVPLYDQTLEARLHLRTGRLEEAKRILSEIKKKKGEEHPHLPQSHRETLLLLSLIEGFMGNGMETKMLAQAGIQLGVRIESPFVEACGWIRMGHAVQILNMYEASLALECYQTALEIMNEIKVTRGKAEPLMGLCLLYGSLGDYQKAIETGHLALEETERVQDQWLSSLIMLSMGIAAIYQKHDGDAIKYFSRAKEWIEDCGDVYGETILEFWFSYLYFMTNEKELFKCSMERFIKHVQIGGYDFLVHKRTLFGPRDLQMFAPLLIEANKQNISPQYIPKLIQDLRLVRLDSHPGFTLRVQTLGGFRVWLGDKEVEDRDWQRGKAKELFQLLLTKVGQYISKEDIYEYLWPEQNEKNASRDFKGCFKCVE